MVATTRTTCRNLLLNRLSDDDFQAILPHLEWIDYRRSDQLIPPGGLIETITFPEDGIFSIVLAGSDGRRIEIGIFGREGMSDGTVLFGIYKVPHETFVQVPGTGLRMRAADLVRIAADRPAMRRLFHRWLYVLSVQTSETALSNGSYSVEERLARWLVMCQDRLQVDHVDLTHEFLGTMLGVQRSTVTLATHILEGANLIRARRGSIQILDREGLMEVADGSYGISENEYEKAIGPFRPDAPLTIAI